MLPCPLTPPSAQRRPVITSFLPHATTAGASSPPTGNAPSRMFARMVQPTCGHLSRAISGATAQNMRDHFGNVLDGLDVRLKRFLGPPRYADGANDLRSDRDR